MNYTRYLIVSLLFVSSPVFPQSNKTIAIGPYVQNVSAQGATICWSTLAGQVKIKGPNGDEIMMPEYEHHEMMLARLQANTTYTYDVLGNGSHDGIGTFKTYPREIVPFTFAVLGDTRSRHKIHKKIISMVQSCDPLFVVNTGDLVSDGRNIRDWETFFQINKELMQTTPYYSVLGNHEKDSKYYFDFFNFPGNERYYHFSVGDALFLFLDTEGADYPRPKYISEENIDEFWNNQNKRYFEIQKAWADHILTLYRDAGFIFVFFHEPLFSIKKSRVEDAKLRRAFWGDLFKKHAVQVVLNGHDHHYHHAISGGTHYITTAGGGAGLYDTDVPQPETIKYKKIEHFVQVEVGLEQAKLTAIDIDGNIIEEIMVKRRK